MKNKGLTIALACAIGAGLGTMLAIEFGKFYVFGLLIGSLSGYLIYELPTVIKMAVTAFHWAKKVHLLNIQWKSGLIRTNKITLGILAVYLILTPMIIFAVLDTKYPHMFNLLEKSILLILLIGGIVLRMSILCISILKFEYKAEQTMDPFDLIMILSKKNRFVGITCFLLAEIISIGLLIKSIIYSVGKLFKFTGSFLWRFFKLIHSDLRLLVGIDSLIGGMFGFYYDSILYGMIFGAVWGLINYYIVSIKIMKLKPSH